MKIKRPLVPGFLKTAEQKLLLNKPGVWSTRTHLVVYYGVLFIIALAGLCFLDPTDLRDYSITSYWVGYVIIISIIALTVWLIYLLRFNLFKKYGKLHPLYMLGTFGLYFIAVGTIVLFSFIHPVVESVRANMKYSDEEIVDDINAINLKLCQFESGLLHIPWIRDTAVIVKSRKEPTGKVYYDDDVTEDTIAVAGEYVKRYLLLDSAHFNERRAETDSLVKINDTMYILFNTPKYTFIDPYEADKYTRHKLTPSFDIYKKVYQTSLAIDKAAIGKELGLLLKKYRYPEVIKYLPEIIQSDGPFEIVQKRYQLGTIENSFSNIVAKKYRWKMPYLAEALRLFYYFTMGIALLLFIFRHSTVRTFFLSVLTGILLTILTSLMLSYGHNNDTIVFAWIIGYFILFFISSLAVWSIKKRTAITGILINLFVVMVPVFPLLVFGWYYSWKRAQYYNSPNHPIDYVALHNIEKLGVYAEVGSAIFLLVLLATYISKLYRRWYSLPEE